MSTKDYLRCCTEGAKSVAETEHTSISGKTDFFIKIA